MRIGYIGEEAKPMDPEELLRRFRGRMAIVDALAYASIDCHWFNRETELTSEPPLSEDLATGLRELSDDFEDLQRGILLWIEQNNNRGAS
jgi:hypothetical protein